MTLSAGTRIGVYEVSAKIGEGGMGEVYRARDAKLGRDVALKVLPEAFTDDPDRLARFEREARVLASLNHPNIAGIFGFEREGDVRALALELVEGQTLAERIARGAIPVDEALPIATQIAEALEAAHEAGVIHRDLKPANIKVREDGTVKVLDFGLAKALDPAPEGDPSQSPTLTAAATQMGVIMGTAAYMSPEQARGKSVDKRTDIWAYGCVLYEMLTGRRAFQGEDVSLTLASVMKSDVDVRTLPEDLPDTVRTVLRGCLQKDPTRRLRDIGDLRLALDGAFETEASVATEGGAQASLPFWQRPLGVLGLVAAAVAATSAVALWSGTAEPPVTNRLMTVVPEMPRAGSGKHVALSADGRTVLFSTNAGLWVQSMDRLGGRLIPGTQQARYPFLSPDGAWAGYVQSGTLRTVSLSGQESFTLCECDAVAGGGWGADDVVVFGARDGLYQVPAAGGEPVRLTESGQERHMRPQPLPGGKGVLVAIAPTSGQAPRIAVYSRDTGELYELLDGSEPSFAVGHLLFGRGNSVWAAPFDPDELAVTGDPFLVVEGVAAPGLVSLPQYAAALDGTLVYLPETSEVDAFSGQTSLVWVDREGQEEDAGFEPSNYYVIDIAPDGRSAAVDQVGGDDRDVWVLDLERQIPTRLTFDPGADSYPVWTPDGERLVWGRGGGPARSLFWQSADGRGTPERLTDSDTDQVPLSVSPDGETLLFIENRSGTPGYELGFMPLTVGGTPTYPGIRGLGFTLSPDGNWVAYSPTPDTPDGLSGVFVRPFPDVDAGQWQLARDGGVWPVWSPDGDELFFRGDEGMMVVPVETGEQFDHGRPELLFERDAETFASGVGRSYDVDQTGDRFLMVKQSGTSGQAQLVIVQNWLGDRRQ